MTANEFYTEWSKANFTKVAFRDHIKKLPAVIPPGTDVKDINALFDLLDADHGIEQTRAGPPPTHARTRRKVRRSKA